MVRPIVVNISVDSVCDALASVQSLSHPPSSKAGSVEVTPVPYPIGGATLQVTGVHVTLTEKNKAHEARRRQHDRPKSLPEAVVVLLRAHVRGRLDAKERVFTVAALTLGLGDSSGKPLPLKGATGAGAETEKKSSANSAYAKLDLRAQMERVRFSVEVRPLGARRIAQKRLRASAVEEKKADESPVDWLLRVTVMGTVSSLLLL